MNSELSRRLDPQFESLLSDHNLDQLEETQATVYGFRANGIMGYVNSAWDTFAAENGGQTSEVSSPIGQCLYDVLADAVGPFYRKHFRRCLEADRPWEHTYECSSATVYREFHMQAFPLGKKEGLLVVNSLRVESSHWRKGELPFENAYRNAQGLIVQCANCRRIRRVKEKLTWDWVPQWVQAMPPRTSHGICELCLCHYMHDDRSDRDELFPISTIGE